MTDEYASDSPHFPAEYKGNRWKLSPFTPRQYWGLKEFIRTGDITHNLAYELVVKGYLVRDEDADGVTYSVTSEGRAKAAEPPPR